MGSPETPELPAVDRLLGLFESVGRRRYDEVVTQVEHALQSAQRAEEEGAPDEEIVAALLHDLGHMLVYEELAWDSLASGDDHHEEIGARFLALHFPPAVSEPVRLHVAAKRYLCATEAEYRAGLSPASLHSLGRQGGPMSPEECAAFEAQPFFPHALRLRRRDDEAKVAGRKLPPIHGYCELLRATLRTS